MRSEGNKKRTVVITQESEPIIVATGCLLIVIIHSKLIYES